MLKTFKPSPNLPGMIPGLVLVPLYKGAQILNVFQTGGVADPTKWIRGTLDGAGHFDSLEDAQAAAESRGSYLVTRADHFAVIARGGLFDV